MRENETEAGKVRWVQPDGPDDVGGPVGQCGWSGRTMWVVQLDEGGDSWMKMGTAGQRWGQPDKDGDSPTKMGTNPDTLCPCDSRPPRPRSHGYWFTWLLFPFG